LGLCIVIDLALLPLKARCGIIETEALAKRLRRCPMKVYDFKVLLEPDEEARPRCSFTPLT